VVWGGRIKGWVTKSNYRSKVNHNVTGFVDLTSLNTLREGEERFSGGLGCLSAVKWGMVRLGNGISSLGVVRGGVLGSKGVEKEVLIGQGSFFIGGWGNGAQTGKGLVGGGGSWEGVGARGKRIWNK